MLQLIVFRSWNEKIAEVGKRSQCSAVPFLNGNVIGLICA